MGTSIELSQQHLLNRASRVAYGLGPQRVESKRVVLRAEASEDFFVGLLALQTAGAAPVLIDATASRQQLESQSRMVQAACELALPGQGPLAGSSLPALEWIESERDSSAVELDLFPDRDDREACIVFTSGSSGEAKGIVHTMATLLGAARRSNARTGFSAGDRWLGSLTPAHIGGLCLFYRCLVADGLYVLPNAVQREAIESFLQNGGAEFCSLVPDVLEVFLASGKKLHPEIRTILLGGAAPSRRLLELLREVQVPVLLSYGMTETAAHVVCTEPKHWRAQLGSSGKPLEGVEVEIQNGLIAIRGQVAAKIITGDGTTVLDPARFFQTQDLGSFDDDGCLFVLGRNDRIIKSGGEKVSLTEIEKTLEGFEGLVESAAVGIADQKWGARPIIVCSPELPGDRSDQILADLRSALGPVASPDAIVCLTNFPRTPIGKVDFRGLVQMLKDRGYEVIS